ncbi:MAG: dihydroxyacetone kinase family protein, partial [Propionibacteriaceae bacterium]|nr:dihydroxyacetone kinase family protein [Propionibacteriaceae bacterium]
MTHIFNNPESFDEDSLNGFCKIHKDLVRPVVGGVVRRNPGAKGKVAVLYGGGSGHYPIFYGLVGPGMADGAVVGNIFTSPSAHYGYSVARAANRGGGVIFAYGNYAGDVMNFQLAGEQLRAEGIDARQVVITDDVLSAGVDEIEKRRGIAGDLVVFKILAAAADTGADIDEVERLGRLANDRTRSIGVAFSGCTMPGADHPLFTVEPGTIAVGLGLHGEPGLESVPMEPANELAKRLVSRLLEEAPVPSGRVGAILNGLGATKYEELFVLWNDIQPLLEDAGYEVVDPEVGELATSLDMAGLSLTLVWLNEELAPLWKAPAYSAAFRKGAVIAASAGAMDEAETAAAEIQFTPGTPESQRAAKQTAAGIGRALDAIRRAEDELGRLDAVAGDGDHGRGMLRGIVAADTAAKAALPDGAGVGTLLNCAGAAWAADAGGTSGVLWGSALRAAGAVLGDSSGVGLGDIADAAEAFTSTLARLGKVSLQDKTMYDAAVPAAASLRAAAEHG